MTPPNLKISSDPLTELKSVWYTIGKRLRNRLRNRLPREVLDYRYH